MELNARAGPPVLVRRVHEEQRKKKEVKKKQPACERRVPRNLAVSVACTKFFAFAGARCRRFC